MKNTINVIMIPVLSIFSLNAFSYSIIIENNATQYLMPYVESLNGLAPDSVNSWIEPGHERIYDNRSTWLGSAAMGVIEGVERDIKIGDANCGKIKFEGVKKIQITEKNGLVACDVLPVPQLTENSEFYYPVSEVSIGYVFAKFNNSGDADVPDSYAEGPQHIYSIEYEDAGFSKVKINAINTRTKKEYPIYLEMYRYYGYSGSGKMNNFIRMYNLEISNLHARYVPEWNTALPSGNYTGITRIHGKVHTQTKEKYEVDLGVNIKID